MLVTDVKRVIAKGTKKEHTVTGFYMDGYLKENLDPIPQFLKKSWDCVGIVSGHGKVRIGKTQVKGSKVLMSDGTWKNIEEIKTGDEVISPDVKTGKYSIGKVIETHSRFCEDIYDVCNKNNNEVLYSCADNHDIPIEYSKTKHSNNKVFGYKRILETIEAKDLAKKSKSWLRNNGVVTYQGFFINKFEGVKNAEVEPYSLGVYLGDGNLSKGKRNCLSINCSSPEVMIHVDKHYQIMSILKSKSQKYIRYRFSNCSNFYQVLVKYKLENKNSKEKFIPDECKKSDSEYRLKLLAGLIDTHGYITKQGIISYTTASLKLAKDIQEICRSLGGNCNVKKIKKGIKKINFSGTYYTLQINLGKRNNSIPLLRPFKMQRLKENTQEKNKIGVAAIKGKSQMVYGFELDSKSKLYITDNFAITHNSTLGAQICYYIAWRIAGGVCDAKDGKSFVVEHPKRTVRFNLEENVVFSAEDLQDAAHKLYSKYGPNQVILYDEGRQGLDSARSMESINKGMQDFFQECGFMGHVIIIVLPNFFKLHEDYAVARSLFLADAWADKNYSRGYFNFYNEHQKELLYFFGKKKLGVIAKYCSAKESFWGKFVSWLPFDKIEYEKKKKIAMEKKRKTRREKNVLLQRDVLIWILNKKCKMKYREIQDNVGELIDVNISPAILKGAADRMADILAKKGEKKYSVA